MIKNVFKRKRKVKGKTVSARTYTGRYQFPGMPKPLDVPLGVTDRQVAREKMNNYVKEKLEELSGARGPRNIRMAAKVPLSVHLSDFLSDLNIRGRAAKYRYNLEKRLSRLFDECQWVSVNEINPDEIIRWRFSRKGVAAKTLNEYTSAVKGFLNWMCKLPLGWDRVKVEDGR